MDETVKNPVFSVETIKKRFHKGCVSALIKHEDGMCHNIGHLKQSRFSHAREVRDVCEIV